jgi:hypothetical protein
MEKFLEYPVKEKRFSALDDAVTTRKKIPNGIIFRGK